MVDQFVVARSLIFFFAMWCIRLVSLQFLRVPEFSVGMSVRPSQRTLYDIVQRLICFSTKIVIIENYNS